MLFQVDCGGAERTCLEAELPDSAHPPIQNDSTPGHRWMEIILGAAARGPTSSRRNVCCWHISEESIRIEHVRRSSPSRRTQRGSDLPLESSGAPRFLGVRGKIRALALCLHDVGGAAGRARQRHQESKSAFPVSAAKRDRLCRWPFFAVWPEAELALSDMMGPIESNWRR